jgi:glutamine synthetase
MIHPGYHLLSEQWADMAEEPLRIVQRTAQALGLPLLSLEVELGPSQVEAVFEATDALAAADNMVLFRSAVKQALRRAGYHATFMCRPPFPNIMSSGWHLHQSLVDLKTGANLFKRAGPAAGSTPADAQYTLSETGEHYLAGPARACARHDGLLHAYPQRLRALPAQRAGAAIDSVGPRQPRRHAARGRPMQRQQHAH